MAYVHCLPARIVQLRHGLDNVISGVLRTHDDEMPFKTRGHVIKAANRVYRNVTWKPSAGDAVLIDGDLGASGIVVDHIERDHLDDVPCAYEHLEALATLLPTHPAASATLRVWRQASPYRIRFANPVTGEGRRGMKQPGILHGAYDPENRRWFVWTVIQDGGTLSVRGVDAHAMPAIAAEVGIAVAAPTVGLPDDDSPGVRPSKRVHVYPPAPFDDVPF